MHIIKLFLFFCFISIVYSKGVQKNAALTESMGQEVIEIGNPIKELPPGMEEEPSAENDDEVKVTSTTIQPATKKADIKKVSTETRRKMKDVDKIDGVSATNEEAKIEKELADIYRDSAANDYSAEIQKANRKAYNPIERSGFKFQPDLYNKAEVERFRTSIDEISCDKSNTQKLELSVTTMKNTEKNVSSGNVLDMALNVLVIFILIIS